MTPLSLSSDQLEIQNAVISSALLTFAERGHLDCWLYLEYGNGGGQGFGGYALYLPKSYTHHKLLSPAGHFLYRVMEIAGVESFDKLKGRTIRVKATTDRVQAIGHIIKDDWFDPAEDFKQITNVPKAMARPTE
jgi:hypothetical protein